MEFYHVEKKKNEKQKTVTLRIDARSCTGAFSNVSLVQDNLRWILFENLNNHQYDGYTAGNFQYLICNQKRSEKNENDTSLRAMLSDETSYFLLCLHYCTVGGLAHKGEMRFPDRGIQG